MAIYIQSTKFKEQREHRKQNSAWPHMISIARGDVQRIKDDRGCMTLLRRSPAIKSASCGRVDAPGHFMAANLQ